MEKIRLWEICYPDEKHGDITEVMTDSGILDTFYDYWSGKMLSLGKSPIITTENCIEDWVTIHWAVEVK
jgi:hypothetical protein